MAVVMDVMIEIVTIETTRVEVTGRNQIARRKRYKEEKKRRKIIRSALRNN
jgi:hypothetical protein